MQLLSGVLPSAQRGPKRARVEAAKDGTDGDEVRSWKFRLRPRLFGRAVFAKAKPVSAPTSAMAPASSAEMAEPHVPMMTSGGHPLPSPKRFSPRWRGSSTEIL